MTDLRESRRNDHFMRRSALALGFAMLTAGMAISSAFSANAQEHARAVFFLRQDAQAAHVEPAPHSGTGQTTAYRYFDDVQDARVIFRKRALPKGASIGLHVLTHDEVYYVVSGRGELVVDGAKRQVGIDTAIYMRAGANVGIAQRGVKDLVLIVSYPPTSDR